MSTSSVVAVLARETASPKPKKSMSNKENKTNTTNLADSTVTTRQNPKRKVRSNPSSPRSRSPVNNQSQSLPASPVVKPAQPSPKAQQAVAAMSAVVLGRERELVPYFSEGDSQVSRHLCELGGKPKSRHHSFSSPQKHTSTTILPSSPVGAVKYAAGGASSTTTTRPKRTSFSNQSPDVRHEYAGAAFENSPSPDLLPRPSFLDENECKDSIISNSAVTRELVFEDNHHVTPNHHQIRQVMPPLSLTMTQFNGSHPYAVTTPVMVMHQYHQPHVAHHYHVPHPQQHQHVAVAAADPSAHLKRLLNIAVA